jgi:enoyl-CoA hydratase
MAQIEVALSDGIATILVNRPDSLNALSAAVLDGLNDAVARCEREPQIRGVIVTGAGRSFVAGADIGEIAQLDSVSGLAFARKGQGVFSRIERLPKPVVAAVNGFALGGGCELALACHVRFASSKARFGLPEVKLGAIPGFGGTQRLTRLIGRGDATALILHGGHIGAEEALRLGLVSAVLEPDALLPHCRRWLLETLANGPRAVASALRSIREGLDLPALENALEVEARLFAAACGTPEMREGTRAFLEKREPKFA